MTTNRHNGHSNEIKRRPEDEDLKKWVVKIREDCEENVAAILKIGHDLIKAREELDRRFGLLFNDAPPFTEEVVPFSWRTGDRYMAIAAHPVLRDSTQESNLPPCWTTLYILSQIRERRLLELIRQHKVHSGMTRSDAERLVSKDHKRLVSKAPKAQLRALKVIVDAMDNGDAEALAVDLVQLVEGEDKECDVLKRLPEVSKFIAELADACKQAVVERRREARKAERKVAKGNGKVATTVR
jgi:hypothetical protein